MKKILLTTMCAALLFAACEKDDENTLTKNASGVNEAEYFVGNFMNIDSAGNMVNRFVGKPLESDTTVVSIRVKDVDEADEMAQSFLPDSVTIKGDKTSWQYDLKDTLNNTQATLQYVHESDDCFASITVLGECSKYVSRIRFVDVNADNEAADEYHYGDTKMITIPNYGTTIFTCINNSAPYYFVHVSPTKYSMERHDVMHYAQMPYAANLAMLKNLANVVAKEMRENIGVPDKLLFPLTFHYKSWANDTAQIVYRLYANILGDEEGRNTFSITNPLFNLDEVINQYIEYKYESPEYWTIYDNHDYPFASFEVSLRTYGMDVNSYDEAAKATPKYEGIGEVDEDYHWSYASPCDGHQYLFIMVEN